MTEHWTRGNNHNVGEWFERDRYETLAICRQPVHARAALFSS